MGYRHSEELFSVTLTSFRDLYSARQSARFLAEIFGTRSYLQLMDDFRELPLELAASVPRDAAEVLARHLVRRGAWVEVEPQDDPLEHLLDSDDDEEDGIQDDEAIFSEGLESETYDELLVPSDAVVRPPVQTQYAVVKPGQRDVLMSKC